jgi:hypothetical protein
MHSEAARRVSHRDVANERGAAAPDEGTNTRCVLKHYDEPLPKLDKFPDPHPNPSPEGRGA